MYKWLVQVMDKDFNWTVIHMDDDWDRAIAHVQMLSKGNVFEGCRVKLNDEEE